MIRPNELIIDDSNYLDHIQTVVDGKLKINNTVPRVYDTQPNELRSLPDLPLIPRSEWSERIKEKVAKGTQLSDLRLRGNAGKAIPSTDQDGVGYCWCHSATSSIMILRAIAGLPYRELSAFAIGCMIKNFRDEGGWGALALDFICKNGVPTSEFWPIQSMDRKNDNPKTWENAALHRCLAGWYDLDQPVYDRKINFDQLATLLLSDIPGIGDFPWWGHSVCLLDLVEVEPGDFGIRIWNSWSDKWGDRGMAVLRGNKAIPGSCTAPRLVVPSVL